MDEHSIYDMTGVASSLMKNILIRNALGNELGVIDITSSSYVTSKILGGIRL